MWAQRVKDPALVTAAAWVAAMMWVRSLAWERPHAAGTAKKNKPKNPAHHRWGRGGAKSKEKACLGSPSKCWCRCYSSAYNCAQEETANPALAPEPLRMIRMELLLAPLWGLSLHQGPAHILRSILAGLLRGQLSN